jgi:hypothetical protein
LIIAKDQSSHRSPLKVRKALFGHVDPKLDAGLKPSARGTTCPRPAFAGTTRSGATRISHSKNPALLHFVCAAYKCMPWIKPEIVGSVFAYIQNHEDHHRNGSLVLEAEPAEEDPTD